MTRLRSTLIGFSFIGLALFALPLAAMAAEPAVQLVVAAGTEPLAVVITGIDPDVLKATAEARLTRDEWPKVARVVVDPGTDTEAAQKLPVAGEWSIRDQQLRFEPLYPLAAGVKYRVVCDFRAVPRTTLRGPVFTLTLTVPKPPPGPRVRIVRVYPSAYRLPENTLRMYIHFSGPVARGEVYSRIRLIRDDGKEVVRPFVELDEELWSPDGLRLTLLFDPGRVKRGLSPREEHGPILEEGRRYTFIIDAQWPDTEGRPLLAPFRKTFVVTAPDDEPVWPNDWKLLPPPASSDAPLIIRLAKPLDHALLGRLLWVVDATGQPVDGTISVGGGERVVTFTPAQPWRRGNYKLIINDELEDVCGNRVGEPFEVDVFKPIPLRPMVKLTERPFTVK
ncbi:MAG: hypothetical protein RMJ56_05900 [Gemmataceae bacterium]|nr:hypothetical protein [Gemmata sp.]MDW8197122.1 hypothetical protein [Gemmataceae bacterium]